jgi:hypothetical protein
VDAAVFNHRNKSVYELLLGESDEFEHSFGGEASHKGSVPNGCSEPMQLLFCFDLRDPRLGVEMGKQTRLPLYYGFRYDGSEFGYQLVSDQEIRVFRQSRTNTPDDFPYADYPTQFPRLSVRLARISYDPTTVEDATKYGGIFGVERLSETMQQQLCEQRVGELDAMGYRNAADWSLAELIEGCSPFHQGVPASHCANQECVDRQGAMKVLCFVEAEPYEGELGVSLWGGPDVQLVFQFCPNCRSIYINNQI